MAELTIKFNSRFIHGWIDANGIENAIVEITSPQIDPFLYHITAEE